MNPQPEIVEAIRTGAKRDLDTILDALPLIADEARARHKTGPAIIDDGTDKIHAHLIRTQGDHSDKTGDMATRPPTQAQQWLADTTTTLRRLQTLVAKLDNIIGKPTCPQCHEPLTPNAKTIRYNGVPHHRHCYDAARYEASRANDSNRS